MLARLNVAYVIAGHSERRAHCGETDEVVRNKVDAIYRLGMHPILCVGETAGERRDGAAVAKVRWQVAAALAGRPAGTVAAAVIAYEPLWAIGAGQLGAGRGGYAHCAARALAQPCARAEALTLRRGRRPHGAADLADTADAVRSREPLRPDDLFVCPAGQEVELREWLILHSPVIQRDGRGRRGCRPLTAIIPGAEAG